MERNCLKCNKPFESEGPGNRLCTVCNLINAKTKDIRVATDPSALISSFNTLEPVVLPAAYFKGKGILAKKKTNPKSGS